jgi:hypothetical protein
VFSGEAMRRIRAVEPAAKAIVLLRDPVERAYSHYLNDVREGLEQGTFPQAIRWTKPLSRAARSHGICSAARSSGASLGRSSPGGRGLHCAACSSRASR